MKAIVKNNIFIMMLICLFLVVTINNTYSKFTYSKEIRGKVVTIASLQTLYEMLLSKSYTLDINVNFGAISSSTNGVGLMMMSSTQNDEYPIVYYRGDVANNNVIFADLCWLIVITTETGGIKLLFNGPVVKNTDGTQSCMNYSGVGGQSVNANSTDVFAGNIETLIATSYDSPVYTGYMYNDTNKFYNKSANVLDSNEYINHLVDNSIDNETGRHTQNKMDLKVKLLVDEWYESNILVKTEESLLEDTIWCVDRSVISSTYTIENYATNNEFYFAAFTRLYENATKRPSLLCARDVDKFTVNSSNGNGDLTYPVGMLTADEINM